MKMLDAYRMQLWTRMAQQQQQLPGTSAYQHQQPASPSPPPLTGLAANLRPHYFTSAQSVRSASATPPPFSSLLSGKPHHSNAPAAALAQMPTPQHAALATMASQTLMQRLGSAFWQAFSGAPNPYSPSSSHLASGGARAPAWDAEKVRRVLEGTAVVRVVDVDPPLSVASAVEAAVVVAEAKESKGVQTQTHNPCCSLSAARETGLSVLEESMRALTLGKKCSDSRH